MRAAPAELASWVFSEASSVRHTANCVASLPAQKWPRHAMGAIKRQVEATWGVQGCPTDKGDGALPSQGGLRPVLHPCLLLG